MSKVCLVIGGTGGLGQVCAEELASAGYKVIVAGRNKIKGDDAVAAIKSKGGEATFVAFDISDALSIKNLHDAVISLYGRLDVAVNAAGITGTFSELTEFEFDNIHSVIQINVTGVIVSMQEQIRLMKNNPGGSSGRIINFSSIYGLHGCKLGSIYAASKHALVGLTKSAALEYSNPKYNILINAVAPGVVITEMTAIMADPSVLPDGEMKDYLTELPNQYPSKRYGDATDVARGVRFLVESPWVAGTVLEIDGGFGAK